MSFFGSLFPRRKKPPPASAQKADDGPVVAAAVPAAFDTEEARGAVHEAGHALVALRCTLVARVERVLINDRGGGNTRFDFVVHRDRSGEIRREALRCNMVISLAGLAAEVMIYHKARAGVAANDLCEARDAARDLVAKGERIVLQTRGPGAGLPRLPFDRMFLGGLCAEEHVLLQRGYAEARGLLQSPPWKARHAELTAMLLARRNLDQATLTNWFGERGFLTVVGLFSGRFL